VWNKEPVGVTADRLSPESGVRGVRLVGGGRSPGGLLGEKPMSENTHFRGDGGCSTVRAASKSTIFPRPRFRLSFELLILTLTSRGLERGRRDRLFLQWTMSSSSWSRRNAQRRRDAASNRGAANLMTSTVSTKLISSGLTP